MAKEPRKLTSDIHDILVDAFRRGLSKAAACRAANIHRNTLNKWLQAGRQAGSGKQRALYLAVEDACDTFWEAKQSELEQVIYKQATEGHTTVSMKFSRVLKLSTEDALAIEAAIEHSEAAALSDTDAVVESLGTFRERFESEGILYKQDVTVRQHTPDGHLGLEILARRSPEDWGKYETLKLEMDIKSELRKLGVDPEEMITEVVAAMDAIIAERSKGQGSPSALSVPELEKTDE